MRLQRVVIFFAVAIAALLVGIGGPTEVCAQRLSLFTLPNQGQLPVANVHRVMQDREGYLWYATLDGGLCRDDGYRVTVFRNDRRHVLPMKSNNVTALAEASDGSIWFGTSLGAYRLDKHDYSIQTVAATDGKEVNVLLALSDGTMAVACKSRLMRFSAQGKLLNSMSLTENGHAAWASDLCQEPSGRLIVAMGGGGLYAVDRQFRRLDNLHWPYAFAPSVLAPNGLGKGLWVGTWGMGLVRWDGSYHPEPLTASAEATGGFGAQVIGVATDAARRRVWVVTMDNLYAYQTTRQGLRPMDLSGLFAKRKMILDKPIMDRLGNLVVPGFSPHTFFITTTDAPITRDALEPMARRTGFKVMADRVAHADGPYYWLWQGRVQLSLYNQQTQDIVFATDRAVPSARAFDKLVVPVRQHAVAIWTAQADTVYCVWHEGMTIHYQKVCVAYGHVRSLAESSDRLFIGTDRGLCEYVKASHNINKVSGNFGAVRYLMVEPQGKPWLVTSRGLMTLDAGHRPRLVKAGRDFVSVTRTPDGTLWAASRDGNVWAVRRSGSGYSVRLSEMASTNGDVVKTVQADSQGHLWILSDQYLRELNPRNGYSRWVRNSDKSIRMDYFHDIRVEGDRVLLGGIGAFCYVPHSARLDHQARRWMPRVTRLSLDGKQLLAGPDQALEIPAGTKSAVLYVSDFDFLNARRTRYAYRLDPDDPWTELDPGDNRIVVSGLGRGHYQLELKAMNDFGLWGPVNKTVLLTVHGHWYTAWWFLTLVFVLLVATLVTVIVKNQKTLERMRKRFTPRKLRILFTPKSEEERLKARQAEKEQANRDFLEKVRSKVKEHLMDNTYGVEALSRDMLMTRQHLYFRMQEAAGLKPVDFIRDMRLQAAAELLATTSLTVAEISNETGFTTPRYFSHCFKEKFGVLPTEYRKNAERKGVDE